LQHVDDVEVLDEGVRNFDEGLGYTSFAGHDHVRRNPAEGCSLPEPGIVA
jgi:hypothetical protein